MATIALYVLIFLAPLIFAWAAVALGGLDHEYEGDAGEPLPPANRPVTRPSSPPVPTAREDLAATIGGG